MRQDIAGRRDDRADPSRRTSPGLRRWRLVAATAWFGVGAAWAGDPAPAPAPGVTVAGVTVAAASAAPPAGVTPLAARPAAREAERDALLAELMAWAVQLSGLPAAPDRPPVIALSAAALSAAACPDDPRVCRGLVALYDTDRVRVLIRDSLDLADPSAQSFVVHEFVHHLQHRAQGAALVGRCEGVIAAESQAYAVQNRFLAHQRQMLRVGDMVRRMQCDSADADPVVVPFGTPLRPVAAGGVPTPR